MVKLLINGIPVLDENIIDFEGKESIDLMQVLQKVFKEKMKYSHIDIHYHHLQRESEVRSINA